MKTLLSVSLMLVLSLGTARAAWFDFLGLGKKSTNQPAAAPTSLVPALSQEQVVAGLKEALGKGLQQAVSQLGRENGFLTNLNVKIPMPEKLQKVERTLRALKQNQLADDFVQTMNRAAEQAVPQAGGVFADAVKQLSFANAKGILTGTNNAATQYFRRATEANLFGKFLPIVKEATGKTGVTSAYKKLMEKAGGGTAFGSFGRSVLGAEAVDVDAYVTNKALDGLFKMVAEEEKRIRENPLARTSQLLQRVFGTVAKQP